MKQTEARFAGLFDLLRPLLALAIFLAAFSATPANAAPPAPDVSIGTVSNVSYASAHVSGEINPLGFGFASYNFEVSTDEITWTANAGGFASGKSVVSADLTGLKGGTTYFVRLTANNFQAGGVTRSAPPNPKFTTLPVEAPTVVSTDNASEVAYTLAKASGEVHRPANPDPAFDANCHFQFVTDAQFNATGFESPGEAPCEPENVTTAGDSGVTGKLSGLTPATTYHLRLLVANAGGSDSKAAAGTFTTLGPVPTPTVVAADNASNVAYTTAKAAGKVDRPAGEDPALNVSCRFEYVTAAQFTASGFANAGEAGCEPENPITNAGAGESEVEAHLGGLAVGTTYHLRLTVSNQGGSDSKEAVATFTTLTPTPPSVVATDNASNVAYATAKVSGKVNRPAGADPTFDANCRFEYVTAAQFTASGFANAGEAGCQPENPITNAGAGESEVEAHLGGLAVGTTYHLRLTVSNAGGSDSKAATATFTTLTPTPPTVSIDPIAGLTATTVHFSGKVNPNGTDPTFKSSWHFQCAPACPGVEGQVEADGAEHEVTGDPGLEPNTNYQVKLIASNQGGQNETGPVAFKTLTLPPFAQTLFAGKVEANSATIAGKVNSHNSAVTYQFEYGLDESYGSFDPASPTSLGEVDDVNHEVSASLTGLLADSTYHFRISATNTETDETSHGEDHTFTTPPAAGPKSCPNEQLRAENNSLALPDCRAYEQVSPVDKYGNYAGIGTSNAAKYSYATADGNGMLYGTNGPEGTVHRGVQYYAIGRRGADGWSSESALPSGPQERIFAATASVFSLLPSNDLSKIVFTSSGSWAADNPDSITGSSGIYLGHADGAIDWLSRPQIPNPVPAPGNILYSTLFRPVGASPDLSTVYFWGEPTLLPADAARAQSGLGGWGLYEYTDGELKPAGTLPDGTESPGGAAPAATGEPFRGQFFNNTVPDRTANQVSRDGSTLFFVSPEAGPNRQLYVRRNGHSTLVSHMPNGTPAPSGAAPVEVLNLSTQEGGAHQFAYGAADGRTAIFQSTDALAPGAPNDSSLKAYRYDVATDTVTYLPGVGGSTPVAASDDGRRFLFGRLGGAGNEGVIAVWDEGAIRTIFSGGVGYLSPARATAPGSVFVFSTKSPIPGSNSGGVSQVYRYDVAHDQLTCLSCPPDAITPSGDAVLSPEDVFRREPEGELIGSRSMSSDGKRVFFDTPDALVPQDTNGRRDVYEWTPGGLSLISSGKSSEDSLFLDNSADGSDVFFTTSEGLDPRDTDGVYDVYDARIHGGFRQTAAVAPCVGNDGCKRPTQAQPAQPGSAANSPGPSTPRFKFGTARLAGTRLKLKVTAPVPATVAAGGKGLKSTRRSYPKAGSHQLEIPLTSAARKALREKHRLKLKVHLAFTPSSGAPSSADVVLTVKG